MRAPETPASPKGNHSNAAAVAESADFSPKASSNPCCPRGSLSPPPPGSPGAAGGHRPGCGAAPPRPHGSCSRAESAGASARAASARHGGAAAQVPSDPSRTAPRERGGAGGGEAAAGGGSWRGEGEVTSRLPLVASPSSASRGGAPAGRVAGRLRGCPGRLSGGVRAGMAWHGRGTLACGGLDAGCHRLGAPRTGTPDPSGPPSRLGPLKCHHVPR